MLIDFGTVPALQHLECVSAAPLVTCCVTTACAFFPDPLQVIEKFVFEKWWRDANQTRTCGIRTVGIRNHTCTCGFCTVETRNQTRTCGIRTVETRNHTCTCGFSRLKHVIKHALVVFARLKHAGNNFAEVYCPRSRTCRGWSNTWGFLCVLGELAFDFIYT
jgi:hypothetical protein